ncbi:MAG: hypothetical protein D9V47_00795 [Clostridia bacterium]|nr:MAG: hypothetical protein D9V47_00795 [Clostridia bacterium]
MNRGEQEGDLRNKAGAKARHRMHELEIEMIRATDGSRDAHNWLILDGAVKLDEFVESRYLVGVAKSFRKDPQFYLGRRSRGRGEDRRDVTAILAGLPHAHRTAAFSAYNGKVAFWYVRLREQRELDYPLMGVVKVELPRPGGTPVEAELADLISRALVAERNVTPFGRDRRWHCHLATAAPAGRPGKPTRRSGGTIDAGRNRRKFRSGAYFHCRAGGQHFGQV